MIATYAPGEVAMVVNGNIMSGFMDGTIIVVESTSEGNLMEMGTDGGASYVISADKSGTITMTLKQTSDSNRILGALRAANTQSSVILSDNIGDKNTAKDCLIKQFPSREYADVGSGREWIIMCPVLEWIFPSGVTPATT